VSGRAPEPSDTAVEDRALAVVARLAERLRDPDLVSRRTVMVLPAPPGGDQRHRHELRPGLPPRDSLANGLTGVCLLFAELGGREGGYGNIVHRFLGRAGQVLSPSGQGLLGSNLAGLAFAARAAARRPGDYARLLITLDRHLREEVRALTAEEHRRLREGRAGTRIMRFDTVSGLAGLGGYFLARGDGETLRPVLTCLSALADPVTLDGEQVPGWWVAEPPTVVSDLADYPRGHVNLGMAHGIGGPLALLALAWRSGQRVPEQKDAMERIVEQLLACRGGDGTGRFWPSCLAPHDFEAKSFAGGGDRVAWCYGTPGMARAVYLAALALGRADWAAEAVTMLRASLSRPRPQAYDCTMCHGWAGLLHIATLMARDTGDDGLAATARRLASEIVRRFDSEAPFGYRYWADGKGADQPGFLTGATGIALALLAFTDGRVTSGWDRCLLLD
jgi:hypothetical protein